MTETPGEHAGWAAVSLKPQEFLQIGAVMHERYGIDLRQGKEGLVAARLGKKLREGGFRSFGAYFEYVMAQQDGEALIEMVDALTTNHTALLREPQHFEFLANTVVPEFVSAAELRIWSAACSTGEEPYSIACMLLAGGLPQTLHAFRVRFRILASDLSSRALKKARAAVYPDERFEEFPQEWRSLFLQRERGEFEGSSRFKPEITASVDFERLNLVEPFHHGNLFHVIFCRNVMMYFDRRTQEDVVARLSACLEPGGYLFTGHSESLMGIRHDLTYVRPAIYRRRGAAGDLEGRTAKREIRSANSEPLRYLRRGRA